MNNTDFWKSIEAIVTDGFTPEGLQKLDHYAELFINGRLVYQRFSPFEQHGCAAGGPTHVIASLLAGAETAADRAAAPDGNDFKAEVKRGTQQAERIERWARAVMPPPTSISATCTTKTLLNRARATSSWWIATSASTPLNLKQVAHGQ